MHAAALVILSRKQLDTQGNAEKPTRKKSSRGDDLGLRRPDAVAERVRLISLGEDGSRAAEMAFNQEGLAGSFASPASGFRSDLCSSL
jgi:hypothetical protein